MAGPHTSEFTDQNFDGDVLSAAQPVLVDFWAEWCGPCKALGPVIDELASEYEGRVKVGKVNVDDNQNLAIRYGVMNIPTVIIFQNGQIKQKFVGLRSKKDFKVTLDQLLAGA